MGGMMYQVDNLEGFDDATTEEFSSLEAAYLCAVDRSYNDSPIGVWEKDSSELRAIVYQQEIFTP
jgi:hypothetical protein